MPASARLRQPRKSLFNCLSHTLTALLLGLSLAACGGGGGGSAAGTPNAGVDAGSGGSGGTGGSGSGGDAVASAFTVEADREATSAGGDPVMLQANTDPDDRVEWQLASGSPGSVVATGANTAEYRPPAEGAAGGGGSVNIIASLGDVTQTITLVLHAARPDETGTEGAQPGTPDAPTAGGGGGGSDGSGSEEPPPVAAPGIYLIAGNDFGAGMADGIGTQARFSRPGAIAHDGRGNLYVADRGNRVIRRIDAQGRVSVLAGMPGIGAHVDGTGLSARFSLPTGVAVDASGDLYVYDAGTIRRVTPTGNVTTVAGQPNAGRSQDGTGSEALFFANPAALAFGPDGNLYIAERNSVRRMTPEGTVTTIADNSGENGLEPRFIELNGIAVASDGTIYVTDGGFVRVSRSGPFLTSAAVHRISEDGSVSLLAGAPVDAESPDARGYADGSGTAARFSFPQGMVIDADGNLYVNDRGNKVIRRITLEGDVSTVAGVAGSGGSNDGPVDDARFNVLAGMAIDPSGNLFVTDPESHTVRRVVPGGAVSTVAGAAPLSGSADGTGEDALFRAPGSLARDASGNLYVADTGNGMIRRIAPDGSVTTVAGRPGDAGLVNGPGAEARFRHATGVAVDGDGNVFVADQNNRVIRRIDTDGNVTTYAGGGTSDTGYADGPAASAAFVEPTAVTLDDAGNVFVADRAGDAVRMITPQGMVSTLYGNLDDSAAPTGFGSPHLLSHPVSVALDGRGYVYTVDSHSAVRRIARDGTMETLAGVPFEAGERDGTGAQARFTALKSVVAEPDGTLYVADGQRIRRITPDGMVTTVAGYGDSVDDPALRRLAQSPRGLVLLGPGRLGFLAGNGVFELRLP